ncbi:MAG TPA: hypothetical protein VGK74_08525 [Symbiobacteriaceae bacterium]|jgi:hypothetical protein
MSVNEHRIHLVQTEAMGTNTAVIVPKIRAAAHIVLGLLEAIFGIEDRNMENWAKTERVTWYHGCGR